MNEIPPIANEKNIDSVNSWIYITRMQSAHYRIYWFYMMGLAALIPCGLGLAVCFIAKKLGADWATDAVVLSAFIALFILVLLFLYLLHFRKCPACGKHSLKLDCDPVDITSTEFVTQHFYVHCRHCEHFAYTDLGIKSNIFLKHIPVRMKAEDTRPS